MEVFYLTSGILIVVLTACDFFFTTISFNGAGPLSSSASSSVAALLIKCSRLTNRDFFLRFSGIINIISQAFLWFGLLWAGFFLMLMGDVESVVHSSTNAPSGIIDKLYFSGYVLSTLGNGEFIPGGPFWKVVTAILSFAGFIFITTAMTYLINLTAAVIHKRTLSSFISNLGSSPEEIIINAFDGKSFSRLINKLPQIQLMISKHTQKHFSHPAVHYYFSTDREDAFSVNLTNLDEALTILSLYVNDDNLERDIRPPQDSIKKFLKKIHHQFILKGKIIPQPRPDFKRLKQAGIPVKQEPSVSVEDSLIKKRRDLLTYLLHSTGRDWNDIY